MTDKVQIMVFKKSGKFYTGDSSKWYDVPEGMMPWGGIFNQFVRDKEVQSPEEFIFVVSDHPDNINFFTRLIHGDR